MPSPYTAALAPWNANLLKPAAEAKNLPRVVNHSDKYCVAFSDPLFSEKLARLESCLLDACRNPMSPK